MSAFIINRNVYRQGGQGHWIWAGDFHWGDYPHGWRVAWRFGRRTLRFFLLDFWEHNVEPAHSFAINLPFLFYFGISREREQGNPRFREDRCWMLRVSVPIITAMWACDDDQWPPRFGRKWTWNWQDALLGKATYHSELISVHETTVTMPEADYPIRVEMRRDTWTRPRWKTLMIPRARITCLVPVPVPGKGENSWDMDEDAIYEMTTEAMTVEDAADAVHESAMRDRKKYGNGYAWRPEAHR